MTAEPHWLDGEPCDICHEYPPNGGGRLYERRDGYLGWACDDQHACARTFARRKRTARKDAEKPWIDRGRRCRLTPDCWFPTHDASSHPCGTPTDG